MKHIDQGNLLKKTLRLGAQLQKVRVPEHHGREYGSVQAGMVLDQ